MYTHTRTCARAQHADKSRQMDKQVNQIGKPNQSAQHWRTLQRLSSLFHTKETCPHCKSRGCPSRFRAVRGPVACSEGNEGTIHLTWLPRGHDAQGPASFATVMERRRKRRSHGMTLTVHPAWIQTLTVYPAWIQTLTVHPAWIQTLTVHPTWIQTLTVHPAWIQTITVHPTWIQTLTLGPDSDPHTRRGFRPSHPARKKGPVLPGAGCFFLGKWKRLTTQ